MANLLKGAPVAAALTEQLVRKTERLNTVGVIPGLAILRVGRNPGDLVYARSAENRCGKIGIRVKEVELPVDFRGEELLAAIREINEDDSIHGCLMMRPFPLSRREDERAACALLRPEKDMDGITPGAIGRVFSGLGEGYPPCTAQAVMELLKYYDIPLAGKRVTVIGRSLVIGRPVSMMLQDRDATVTMCHSRTADLAACCREADVLVAAAGRPRMVTAEFTHRDQVIVDVGVNVDRDGTLCGDVNLTEVETVARAVTPVPGGVGSVTTAVLAAHVIRAAERSAGL